MLTDAPERYGTIYLVGEENCLAGALSYVFEREVCSKCVILNSIHSLPAHEPNEDHKKILCLVDCVEKDFEKELIAFGATEPSRRGSLPIALFNLQKGSGLERRAFSKGIKGFFYRDDSIAQILKGLRSMLRGELWMSRDILTKVALQGRAKAHRDRPQTNDLTQREIEILALLSIGSSNDDIAGKLYISPNTVKTHLYRVFRKIEVPNRVQAALWAAKNL